MCSCVSLQASVQSCVLLMVIMAVVFVIVKRAGRGPNVIYLWANVKYQIVRAMVVALKVNAIANVAGRDPFAINVSIFIYVFIFLSIFEYDLYTTIKVSPQILFLFNIYLVFQSFCFVTRSYLRWFYWTIWRAYKNNIHIYFDLWHTVSLSGFRK